LDLDILPAATEAPKRGRPKKTNAWDPVVKKGLGPTIARERPELLTMLIEYALYDFQNIYNG
jgi:hypothetical protein